jgi:hypothetical protein
MLSTLIMMVAACALAGFWYTGRAAAETAAQLGQLACRRANVQWLDQSVHLLGLRLRRGTDGWLVLERQYGFEYSIDGDERRPGRIVLRGGALQSLVGPMPREDDAHRVASPT